MNPFKNATMNTTNTETTNGMAAFGDTFNQCVNLFYAAGASRGKDISSLVEEAYKENPAVTLQILQWLRDCRGGAGERQLFRDAVKTVLRYNDTHALFLLGRSPEIGRWDDLFDDYLKYPAIIQEVIVLLIKHGLKDGNGLLAKWLPRKGEVAVALTKALGMSPKQYRKTIVNLTKVVETQMCNNEWSSINYEHVPSLASARYQKCFAKHDPERYDAYRKALIKGEAKINAKGVYPYDVIKAAVNSGQWEVAEAQWKSIDLKFESKILPIVDVSGSMTCPPNLGGGTLSPMDVSISLGMFLAERNTGPFKGLFVTFSETPKFINLSGSLKHRYSVTRQAPWGMNTNLEKVMQLILSTATKNNISQDDMPDTLLILSDMQFDRACTGQTALDMIANQFEASNYKMPNIVFWNLNHAGNFPTTAFKNNVALVSGFSPSIVTNLTNLQNLTPEAVMLQTVSKYPTIGI